MDGEKETIIMGAAEVICCFFLEEKIHNRPEISDHFHTHVPEGCAKHTYNTRPFENGSAGRREEGLASVTVCTKNKKMKSRAYFPYLSEVCKITRTIQNRFDMGGRVRTPY